MIEITTTAFQVAIRENGGRPKFFPKDYFLADFGGEMLKLDGRYLCDCYFAQLKDYSINGTLLTRDNYASLLDELFKKTIDFD